MNAASEMKTKEQELYEIIECIGETISGDFHIIDTSDYEFDDECHTFRIYHKSGICVDISKEEIIDENTGDIESYEYNFFNEWDGFNKIGIDVLMKLIKDYFKV